MHEDLQRTVEWGQRAPFVEQAMPPAMVLGGVANMAAPVEWEAVDGFSALEWVLSPCSHLQFVPTDFQVAWVHAHVDVFEELQWARAAGDTTAVDTALR
mgnify:CR=1 FL=1